MNTIYFGDELYHHGILGQKWGVRRYQNPDGTLTAAGKKREAKQITKRLNKTEWDIAFHKEAIDRNDQSMTQLEKKMDKLRATGKYDSKKYKKLVDKHLKTLEDSYARQEEIQKGYREINKILDSMYGKPYKINRKEDWYATTWDGAYQHYRKGNNWKIEPN